MKFFVIGDIHGRKKALVKILKKAKFDYEKDYLFILGDIADGGSNTRGVVDELLKIKNKIFILGNHDEFFLKHMLRGKIEPLWINQGGANTINSYGGNITPSERVTGIPLIKGVENVNIPDDHIQFFKEALLYFEFENILFVHAGINPSKPLREQDIKTLLWDRNIIKKAEKQDIQGFKKVFIGHTSTQHIEREHVNMRCRDCGFETSKEFKKENDLKNEGLCEQCGSNNIHQSFGCTKPIMIGNLVCLDTGAGWDGRLTIMNVFDNKEFYQSELLEPAIK